MPQPLESEYSRGGVNKIKNSRIIHSLRVKAIEYFLCCGLSNKQGRFFIVSNQVQGINNNIKAGTCPHGLAPGACPVCSMSGGGTLRQSDRNRKIGEMTYHECAMIGNMLRARALAQKNRELNLQHRAANISQFETIMARASENMKQFIQQMSQNILTKPLAFVVKNFALPIVNFVQNLPKFITNFNLKTFLPEISDKLAAVFGEAKAFMQKKADEIMKALKNKLDGLFRIFKKHNTDDEDTKIDDDKKIFNLKTLLHKVKEKFKHKKDREGENGTENQ